MPTRVGPSRVSLGNRVTQKIKKYLNYCQKTLMSKAYDTDPPVWVRIETDRFSPGGASLGSPRPQDPLRAGLPLRERRHLPGAASQAAPRSRARPRAFLLNSPSRDRAVRAGPAVGPGPCSAFRAGPRSRCRPPRTLSAHLGPACARMRTARSGQAAQAFPPAAASRRPPRTRCP